MHTHVVFYSVALLGEQTNSHSQSHYPDTEPTSPWPILIMLSAWLGSDTNQFLSHWFDLTRDWTHNIWICQSLKMGNACIWPFCSCIYIYIYMWYDVLCEYYILQFPYDQCTGIMWHSCAYCSSYVNYNWWHQYNTCNGQLSRASHLPFWEPRAIQISQVRNLVSKTNHLLNLYMSLLARHSALLG